MAATYAPVPEETGSKKCHLLDLPTELRTQILSYVVRNERTIIFTKPTHARTMQPHTPPGILLACRQIRDEGLPLYFQFNLFRLGPSRTIKLPPEVEHIKRIEIDIDCEASRGGHFSYPSGIVLDITKGVRQHRIEFMTEEANLSTRRAAMRPKMVKIVEAYLASQIGPGQKPLTAKNYRELLRYVCLGFNGRTDVLEHLRVIGRGRGDR